MPPSSESTPQTNALPPDRQLVKRALLCFRPGGIFAGKRRGRPRWGVAMELFGLGSNSARQLCQELDLDPDTIVKQRPW